MAVPRQYPTRPLVGAGAVVHRRHKVLLIRRKFPPNEGLWALPGGLVEIGEKVESAVLREVKEETGLKVSLERLLNVSTEIHLDFRGGVRYHYVLVDYVASARKGRVRLNPESSAARWFSGPESESAPMSDGTRAALRKFFGKMGNLSSRRRHGKRSPKF
ncbi:MAG: NUDIX hydrolase [Thaumarchaeota archaeon]|nr:NUDIX hydrolase [Nitrososphaerota archaeon]